MSSRTGPEAVGLPPRPFLYTLDQIATLVGMDFDILKGRRVYYVGRSVGVCKADELRAVNISPLGERPDWRVPETELVRWMKRLGIRIYERTRTAYR